MSEFDSGVFVVSKETRAEDRGIWREEHIAMFERRYPLGTTARLAFDLALYTAQPRAELRLMGPGQIENGRIRVREYRTGRETMIPMHPRLVASLTLKRGNPTAFLLSDRGRPFASDESFGLWFARKCAEAGLKGYCFRGLRPASARRLAEIGLPPKRVEAITGFSDGGQAQAEPEEEDNIAVSAVSPEELPRPGECEFPVQIRDDLVVRFSALPMDLSRDEAEKICRVILALAAPA